MEDRCGTFWLGNMHRAPGAFRNKSYKVIGNREIQVHNASLIAISSAMKSILCHSARFSHFCGNDTSVGFPIAIITVTTMCSLECVLPSWQHSWFSLMSLLVSMQLFISHLWATVRSLCPWIMFFTVLLYFFALMQSVSRDFWLISHSLYVNK